MTPMEDYERIRRRNAWLVPLLDVTPFLLGAFTVWALGYGLLW